MPEINYKDGKVWTMKNEIEFIRKLGSWKTDQIVSKETLLRNYIKSLEFRSDFGSLDKNKLKVIAVGALQIIVRNKNKFYKLSV